jgi:hypothetical protein
MQGRERESLVDDEYVTGIATICPRRQMRPPGCRTAIRVGGQREVTVCSSAVPDQHADGDRNDVSVVFRDDGDQGRQEREGRQRWLAPTAHRVTR